MNKEESFPELSARWPGGGRGAVGVLARETESDSFSDVGRGKKSESDKAQFPQKPCSLIF